MKMTLTNGKTLRVELKKEYEEVSVMVYDEFGKAWYVFTFQLDGKVYHEGSIPASVPLKLDKRNRVVLEKVK